MQVPRATSQGTIQHHLIIPHRTVPYHRIAARLGGLEEDGAKRLIDRIMFNNYPGRGCRS